LKDELVFGKRLFFLRHGCGCHYGCQQGSQPAQKVQLDVSFHSDLLVSSGIRSLVHGAGTDVPRGSLTRKGRNEMQK
jgi:hypothetical protein